VVGLPFIAQYATARLFGRSLRLDQQRAMFLLEAELDRLSNILKAFNAQFGTLFTDTDRVAKQIREGIAPKVAADAAAETLTAGGSETQETAGLNYSLTLRTKVGAERRSRKGRSADESAAA